jgi:hypothetical protein
MKKTERQRLSLICRIESRRMLGPVSMTGKGCFIAAYPPPPRFTIKF